MSDNQKLIDFLEGVKWSKYIYDKEVQVLATQLKDKITSLSNVTTEDGVGSSGDIHRVKLVAVGDGAVGKTSLLITYAKNDFPKTYVPTVFENYTAQTTREKDGSQVLLHLWDTAGQEDYDRLRPLSYPGADIVLLCFSTVNKSSFESIKEKWHPEVNHYLAEAPTILVGTKVDLRDAKKAEPDREYEPVSTEEAEKMRQTIGARQYIEVSSKKNKNLSQVFSDAIEIVLNLRDSLATDSGENKEGDTEKKKNKKSNCILL